MKISTFHKMARLRAQADAIEKKWAKHRAVLLKLPTKLGYRSMKEFVAALGEINKTGSGQVSSQQQRHMSRKVRAFVTPELTSKVKEMVEKGKTGREIAENLHLATSTVQNIKTRMGLTKVRRHSK